MLRPYFVRDHNRMVHHLIAKEPDYENAMARAVGGAYAETGNQMRRVLESLGLRSTDYVIDIGAGSGRLSTALKDLPNLRYLGTDVVPELLEFARKQCGREDWTFKVVESIEIPEKDGVADFVLFFSVFTHLKEKESFRYLQEAKRVLKKDGIIIVSYLDRKIPVHARVVGPGWFQLLARATGRSTLNKLLSKEVLAQWSKALNLSIDHFEVPDNGQFLCAYRFAEAPSAQSRMLAMSRQASSRGESVRTSEARS
jgi:ubiquinone/menaquinone biosynthesis C-methylase UbiE